VTKILAIDPGVMTGYVYARITEDKQLECLPFQMMDEVDDLWRRLDEFKPNIIVMEDFEFRGRASTGLNLFPVQLIGVVRLWEMTEPTGKLRVFMQKASFGKAYYTDKMLRSHGVYKRGIPHGMDALRHLLQWATFGAGFNLVDLKTGGTTAKIIANWAEVDGGGRAT